MAMNWVPLRREARGQLSDAQEMELWLGPRSGQSAFESEAEMLDLWNRHRVRLMDQFSHHGRRPAIWWRTTGEELGLVFDYDREQSTLFEANALTPPERDSLIAYWRSEFMRASKPGFGFHDGTRWLKGAEGRRAHAAWADVPASLVRQWTEEARKERIRKRAERRSAARERRA
ncbi:MAG: hypothetical protein WAU59_04970 [Rhodoplanes sp.]